MWLLLAFGGSCFGVLCHITERQLRTDKSKQKVRNIRGGIFPGEVKKRGMEQPLPAFWGLSYLLNENILEISPWFGGVHGDFKSHSITCITC